MNSVFKSKEGKNKILLHYKKLLKILTVEFKEKYVDTTYGKTYLIEAGDYTKPPMFLFHGSCSNTSMWFSDIITLSKYYHVFGVDIIGEAGHSYENRLDIKSDDYADWIKEILDVLGIKKAIIMGNSFGGWLSLKFAIKYPERVLKLILIAASGITDIKLSFLLRSIIYTTQGEKGIKKQNKMIFGTDDIPDEVIYVTKMILENFNPMMCKLPIFTGDQLKVITMPVLYIAGENDATVNSKKSAYRINKYAKNVSVKLIEKKGHVIYNILDYILPFLSN